MLRAGVAANGTGRWTMDEMPLLEPDAEAAWEVFVLGDDHPPPVPRGDPEGAAWFRAQLQELGFTETAFAHFMLRRGDDRSKRTVQRSIRRMCAGQARVPGEMRVLLGLMLRSKQRKMARRARMRDEREAPWNDPPETRGGAPENAPAGLAGVRDGRRWRGAAGRFVRTARRGRAGVRDGRRWRGAAGRFVRTARRGAPGQ